MANTRPDINVPNEDWIDAFSATGIAVGTKLLIVNKSNTMVYAQITATKPDAATIDGPPILPFSYYALGAGASGLFLKCGVMGARVNIQEDA